MSARPSPKRFSRRWIVRQPDISRAAELASALGVSPIVAGLLVARGYQNLDSAKTFLNPSLDQLHDPFLMLGMSDAVQRLLQAIDNREPILIYGDYDVDGTTGTAVLLRALRMLGATAGYHVPHRFTEGYGIQQAGLEKAVTTVTSWSSASIAAYARTSRCTGRARMVWTLSLPIIICLMKMRDRHRRWLS